jgi:hypothetical protein
VALLAALPAAGAWAQQAVEEPRPYHIGISQSLMHDSNVFRVPGGPSDTYASTGLLAGFDQTISRQRLYADATVNYNNYRHEDLDHTAYNVRAGWDWATIEKLSGSFTGSATQNLASLDGNASLPLTKRNLARTDQLAALVRWGGEGILTLEGNYGHSRLRYSAPEYLSERSSGDTASLGLFYRAGPTLRLGVAGRYTSSEAPYAFEPTPGAFQAEKGKGRNLDLTADWRYSVQTNMNARLSWTRQKFNGVQERTFSGVTGAIYGNYAPTGKLTFSASLVRDAGINPTFFNVVGAPTVGSATYGLSENSQITDTAAIGVRWAATAKVSANAGYQYRHAKIVNTFGVGGGTTTTSDETDNLRSASIGLTYDITRAWQASCSLAHESRNVSGLGGYEYSANVAGCAVQFVIR